MMVQEMTVAECASIVQSKDKKQKPLGEDAYFISPEGQSFGVADGVGGWTKRGIDAGEYARQLMENSKSSIICQPKGFIDPKEVLTEAHSRTQVPGSSTACVVTIADQVG